jgi:hypothetical protein
LAFVSRRLRTRPGGTPPAAPLPPSNLVVAAGTITDTSAGGTYTPSPTAGAVGHMELWTSSPEGLVGTVPAVAAGAWNVSQLRPETGYKVRMYATTATGQSPYTAFTSFTTTATPVPPPAAPSDLSAPVVASTTATMAWTANADPATLDMVRLQRSATSGFSPLLAELVLSPTATGQDLSGLTADTDNFVRVRNEDHLGQPSAWSNTCTFHTPPVAPPPALPNAPTALAAVAGVLAIELSWSHDGLNSPIGFKIWRATNSSFTTGNTLIQTVGSAARAYTDSVAAGTPYYYRVWAYNAVGDSASPSNTANATATPAGSAPATPGTPTLSGVTTDAITIDVGAVSGAVVVLVEWSQDNYFERFNPGGETVPGTTYTIPATFRAGETYRVRARARNESGLSAPSSSLSVTLAARAPTSVPPQPTGLVLVAGSDTDYWGEFWDEATADSHEEETFSVEESPNGSTGWTVVKTLPRHVTEFKVSGKAAGTLYFVRVRGVNTVGNGTYSATASVTTLAPGAIRSPTGSNPVLHWSPIRQARMESWKAAADAADGSWAADCWNLVTSCCTLLADGNVSNDPTGEYGYCFAVAYQVTANATYAQQWFTWATTFFTTNWGWRTGTVASVTDAKNFTVNTLAGRNLVLGDRILFLTPSPAADPGGVSRYVTAYNSVSKVVTLDTALPALPNAGDTFQYCFEPDNNSIRNMGTRYAWVYDWVRAGLTAGQREQVLNFLNAMSDVNVGIHVPPNFGNCLSTDSDNFAGLYLLFVHMGLTEAAWGNPRTGWLTAALNDRASANKVASVGGTVATGLDHATARNAVEVFVARAGGGSWIESSEYDVETVFIATQVMDAIACASGGTTDFGRMRQFLIDRARFHPLMVVGAVPMQWWDDEAPRGFNVLAMISGNVGACGTVRRVRRAGPYWLDFCRHLWFDLGVVNSNFKHPYTYAFLAFDPAGPQASVETLPQRVYTQGRGQFLQRDAATNHMAYLAHYPFTGVDHEYPQHTEFAIYHNNEWLIDRCVGYLFVWADRVNSVSLGGLGGQSPVRGSLGYFDDPANGFTWTGGATWGNNYGLASFQPPATYCHEHTREYVYLDPDTVVVYDRFLLCNPRLVANNTRWGGYTATVNGSGSVVSGASTAGFTSNYTAKNLATNTLVWDAGTANEGVSRLVKTHSTSTGAMTFHMPLDTAPNVGDTWKSYAYGTDYRQMKADDLTTAQWETIWHCPVSPNVSDPAVSTWTTAGGQAVRHTALLPAGFVRKVRQDVWSSTIAGLSAAELKYQFRITPSTPWAATAAVGRDASLSVIGKSATATLVQSSAGDTLDGTVVSRPGKNDYVLLFGRGSTRWKRAGSTVSFTLTTGVGRVVVTCLDPRKVWTYALDGGAATALVVDRSGVTSLSVSGAGAHSLVLTGS